ncbi:MAG: type I restriction enzyme HsdR N-terminal domain-containing protein [Desulfobacteraceae bacterium]|jgi:hypothetical protein|nr:type I restriction enzyme HsdR N-terminal domain-containing protein [Desulfobacteraceae bacterium]
MLEMKEKEVFDDTLVDFVTGQTVGDIGAERNRQALERFLVTEKGFAKSDIAVDHAFEVTVQGEPYRSRIDLLVSVDGVGFMAVKCPAGSLGSWEREITAAARLVNRRQLPLAVVCDGAAAVVIDTVSGRRIGKTMAAIPSKTAAREYLKSTPLQPLAAERREREAIIFKSYDMMRVNVQHPQRA